MKAVKGDRVEPITKAGLWLASEPGDGTQHKKLKQTITFKGQGVVLGYKDVVYDYNTWTRPDGTYDDIGKVVIRWYLIKCSNGIGWGSGVRRVGRRKSRI